MRSKMKVIRENIAQAEYCDWTESISEQAVQLYERVRNQQYQAKPEEVQLYNN